MKFLIVDDDEDSRVFLERTLLNAGHEVTALDNGPAVRDAARASPPDMIISDILMPDMDGFQLCRQIKEDPLLKNIPIIFYTATYTDDRDKELARAIGIARFLRKPMESAEIIKAVNQVIEENSRRPMTPPESEQLDRHEVDELNIVVLSKKLDEKVRDLEEALEDSKRAEAATRQMEERLRQAHKMEALGQMASGIAHDFNNILFPIAAIVEVVTQDLAKNPEAQANLGKVLTAANQGKNLVQQLLSYCRQQPIEFRPLNFGEVATESIGLLRAVTPSTIEIQTSFNEHVGRILADRTQMQQVIMNLGTNAAHAMGPKSGSISFTLEPWHRDVEFAVGPITLAAGDYAKLVVTDTGCGMGEETLQSIFDPYFTTKPVNEGVGLGLSSVMGIIASHGGAISAASKPDHGTTISCYLPIVGKA